MIFSNVRVKDINYTVHFSPQSKRFTSKNKNTHIIGIQLTGNSEHYFNDRQFTLSENCIYFFNEKEDYTVDVAEKGVSFSVHFTTYEPVDVKSFCIKISDNSSIIRALNSIENQFLNAGGCTAKCLSELYKLFGTFEEIYYKKYLPKDNKILKAKEYINLHFKEKDCITKAAQEYGVTVRRFNDIFKQNFQITPNQYIINHKISFATKLLSSNELSIGDIAILCGFEDIYYFSKTFKKVIGQTPSKYRKQ